MRLSPFRSLICVTRRAQRRRYVLVLPHGGLSMKTNKLLVGAILAVAIAAPIGGSDLSGQSTMPTPIRLPFLHGFFSGSTGDQAELTSLERADAWLNSSPLTPSALRGKVVLVDFWTYTCINWRRTLPY